MEEGWVVVRPLTDAEPKVGADLRSRLIALLAPPSRPSSIEEEGVPGIRRTISVPISL